MKLMSVLVMSLGFIFFYYMYIFFIADTDGVWGSWQSWESCSTSSLSCNSSSVYIRERHCDNPPRAGAGQDCQGISQQQTDVGRFVKMVAR